METQNLNLFIVDDNQLTAKGLKKYLSNFFGNNINISTFYSGESYLNSGNHADIVVLDYFLNEEDKNAKNGLDVLKNIKSKNPETEVVMLSSCDETEVIEKSLKYGATVYVVKRDNAWQKISDIVSSSIIKPVRKFITEFSLPQYLMIFLAVFLSMAIVVSLWIKFV